MIIEKDGKKAMSHCHCGSSFDEWVPIGSNELGDWYDCPFCGSTHLASTIALENKVNDPKELT